MHFVSQDLSLIHIFIDVFFDGIVYSVGYFVLVFPECVGDIVCVGFVVCECDVFILLCVVGIFCFVVFVYDVSVKFVYLIRIVTVFYCYIYTYVYAYLCIQYV